jgi:hypothetical protein
MFILARGGQTYGRFRFGEGPMLETSLQNVVDYSAEFRGSDHKNWIEEYEENVVADDPLAFFPAYADLRNSLFLNPDKSITKKGESTSYDDAIYAG